MKRFGLSLRGFAAMSVLLASLGLGATTSRSLDIGALEALSRNAAFDQFVEDLWPEARRKGISPKLYRQAFAGVTPDPRIFARQTSQAEFSTPIWTYIDKRVSADRIARGKSMLETHARALQAVERRYGVDKYVVASIWGMETNFGSFTGKMSVIRSLATMAFSGGRKKYGRKQLLGALDILQSGDIPLDQFKGSWAGAMGHTQFIPLTYNAYAVDMTGDGKRDIWNSIPDALGSTANYLKKRGWKNNMPWGWEVRLPRGFNYRMAGKKGTRSVAAWAKLGVQPAGRGKFGVAGARARLLLPVGRHGPAFLVTRNFDAILAYNRSNSYALAVAHLADRLAGQGPFVANWPTDLKLLSRSDNRELQKLLSARGFNTGGTSGTIGPRTRSAISNYQHRIGLTPDGYADARLLERLRRGL
ncbi:MAG: lytic murein transglycosylase [Pseudomonadota bacterium]